MAHREGALSAASLMVAGPAAAHAIAIAKRLPSLRVGLHLVVVDGDPVLPKEFIPDIVDRDGRFDAGMVRAAFNHAFRPRVRNQYAREIAAQFDAFRKSGLTLDHVNAHKHFHVHPGIASQILTIGRENGMKALRVPHEPVEVLSKIEPAATPIPLHIMTPWVRVLQRRAKGFGLRTPDAVFGLRWSGGMTAPRLVGLLGHLPPGLTEIYMHPATSNDFLGSAPGYAYAEELAALTDQEVMERVRACGRKIGGYSDAME